MQQSQARYDSLYETAINQGWAGWGGDERIAKGPKQLACILAQPVVPRIGNVLELGCGEGHLCRLFAQHGYTVTGIDISAVAIRWAQEKNRLHQVNSRYLHGDFSQARWNGFEQFDLIVDGNCLHCVLGEGRHAFLKNVSACLANDGIFFVSSLCSQDAETHITLRDGEPYRHIPPPDGLKAELEVAGFEVITWQVHERQVYNHLTLVARISDV